MVLVPGGGWDIARQLGLVPLAQKLTDAGLVVVTTSYRAGSGGQAFPVPVQDVTCAMAYAARLAKDAGVGGGPVIVVGHSAGGHLAALAATTTTRWARSAPTRCRRSRARGARRRLRHSRLRALIVVLRHPAVDDPVLWESGDPIAYAEKGEVPLSLRVLLLAGEDDTSCR